LVFLGASPFNPSNYIEGFSVETASITFTQQLSFLQLFTYFVRVQVHPSRIWIPLVVVAVVFGRDLLTSPSLNDLLYILLRALLTMAAYVLVLSLLTTVLLYKTYGKPVLYTFGREDVTIETNVSTTVFKWSQIARIVESQNEFLLHIQGSTTYRILKASIPPPPA
jgi:hypothetical protein